MDLHLSISNGFVSSKIYDKRGGFFGFDIVSFPFLDGGVPQSACLVINPITVNGYAALINCRPVDRALDSMMAPTSSYSFYLVGIGAFVCCLVQRGSTDYLLLLRIFSGVV